MKLDNENLVDCPECKGSCWSQLRPFKYENDCWTCKATGKVIKGTKIVRLDILNERAKKELKYLFKKQGGFTRKNKLNTRTKKFAETETANPYFF